MSIPTHELTHQGQGVKHARNMDPNPCRSRGSAERTHEIASAGRGTSLRPRRSSRPRPSVGGEHRPEAVGERLPEARTRPRDAPVRPELAFRTPSAGRTGRAGERSGAHAGTSTQSSSSCGGGRTGWGPARGGRQRRRVPAGAGVRATAPASCRERCRWCRPRRCRRGSPASRDTRPSGGSPAWAYRARCTSSRVRSGA